MYSQNMPALCNGLVIASAIHLWLVFAGLTEFVRFVEVPRAINLDQDTWLKHSEVYGSFKASDGSALQEIL